jgi:c-di-GMP-binding flagellar brake protein YcgR
MDRRTKTRIDLQLICRIGAGEVLSHPCEGLIENVSRGGMLMRWLDSVALPAVGSRLIVDIELPAGSGYGPRLMRCHTTVVRVERRPGTQPSVGLRTSDMEFVNARDAIRPGELASMPIATTKLI